MSSTMNAAILLVFVVALQSMIHAKKSDELPDNAKGNLCPKGATLLDSCDDGEGRCVQPGKSANSANGRLKCEPVPIVGPCTSPPAGSPTSLQTNASTMTGTDNSIPQTTYIPVLGPVNDTGYPVLEPIDYPGNWFPVHVPIYDLGYPVLVPINDTGYTDTSASQTTSLPTSTSEMESVEDSSSSRC